MSPNKQMFEGLGAPVDVAPTQASEDFDPTLDSCCQREIESNRKQNAVEAALRVHDRVAKAEDSRRHQQTLSSNWREYNPANLVRGEFGDGCRCCYDPNEDGGEYELLAEARWERTNARPDEPSELDGDGESKDPVGSASDSDSSDDEFDYLLDEDLPGAHSEYDNSRRAELESLAKRVEVANYHGYGVHRQLHPKRALSAVGYGFDQKRETFRPRGAALHLFDAYSPLSASLDLCLEDLASKHPGTKFVRSIGVSTLTYAEGSDSPADWRRGDLPVLLALREGRVVAWSSGLRDFECGRSEVDTRAVELWLESAGVLLTDVPPLDLLCRIRPEEEMLLESIRHERSKGRGFGGMMSQLGLEKEMDIEEDEYYDCGVKGCCKQFYHEHVGIQNDMQDGVLVPESEVAT